MSFLVHSIRRACLALALTLALGGGSLAVAQERDFCDDTVAGNCVDDTMAVIFPGPALDDSTFLYTDFVPETQIDSRIAVEAAEANIQGWSFGIRHDAAFLELIPESVTTEGTIADPAHPAQVFIEPGFNVTEAVDGGYISGIILSFTEDTQLPAGRHIVCRASYRLIADAGVKGTSIAFTDELGPDPTRPIDINLTVGGRAFLPRTLTDGFVGRLNLVGEDCKNGKDDDGDRLVDLEDPDCFDCECRGGPCLDDALYFGASARTLEVDARGETEFVISSRNRDPLFGFQFGVAIRDDGGGFRYSFDDGLGEDGERLVEVLFTNNQGFSIIPSTPNTLLASAGAVASISRGAALAGFAGGDFLDFDVSPGVGGPGFFVGYVSDLDDDANQIPATPPGDETSCPVNELLVVGMGGGGECLADALYFGDDVSVAEVDARSSAHFVISSRNQDPLFGFQFGVAIREDGGALRYSFDDNLGEDGERLVEILFTDDQGFSVDPATPNTLVATNANVQNIQRGAALMPFDGGDFLDFDLTPGVGGPGFFVGYVSDLDDDANVIPATPPGDATNCPLNELLVVDLSVEGCPGYAFVFGDSVAVDPVDATGQTSFSIGTRNQDALLAFQFGVTTIDGAGGVTYAFSSALGTDPERLVEVLMTDSAGNSVVPLTPNRLLAGTAAIQDIRRGAATEALGGGDFLEFDLNPGVGGPGFFVGYVADLDGPNSIPPSDDDQGACLLNEVLVVDLGGGKCPGFAFYFGPQASDADHDARGENEIAISSRNTRELFGFQFGVSVADDGGSARYTFSGDLGNDADRIVEILMTDDLGNSVVPATPNAAVGDNVPVASIERGATLEPFAGQDFLMFSLEPGVGGPGFFVGYVSDLDDDEFKIPVSAGAGDCPLNELLIVRLSGGREPFARADADGNGRVNVTDTVLIIQGILGNLTRDFNCDDLFDTDNNGQLDLQDGLPPLVWLFQRGNPLPAPFLTCGQDNDDRLGCAQSNCQ